MNTTDYRNAPSGIGPQASEWTNKPHRLIYDLCTALEDAEEQLAACRSLVQQWREETAKEWNDAQQEASDPEGSLHVASRLQMLANTRRKCADELDAVLTGRRPDPKL